MKEKKSSVSDISMYDIEVLNWKHLSLFEANINITALQHISLVELY